MKKILMSVLLLCAVPAIAMAIESSLFASVGKGGTISSNSSYYVTGGSNPFLENKFQANVFSVGEARVANLSSFSGAIKYQVESQTMPGATFMFSHKAGTGTLEIGESENRINGILVENAAGISGKLIGLGKAASIFSTADGLKLESQVFGFGSWNGAGVSQIVSGFRTVPSEQAEASGDVIIHATEVGFNIIESYSESTRLNGPLDAKFSIFFTK